MRCQSKRGTGMNKLYVGKLFKINSNHDNVRTDTMEGLATELPVVGKGFNLYGGALELKVGIRGLFTTSIEELTQLSNGTVLFRTRNSTYVFRLDKEIPYDPDGKFVITSVQT